MAAWLHTHALACSDAEAAAVAAAATRHWFEGLRVSNPGSLQIRWIDNMLFSLQGQVLPNRMQNIVMESRLHEHRSKQWSEGRESSRRIR